MEAIVMGSILASAFCVLLILLCLIVVYLNKTNSAALNVIANEQRLQSESTTFSVANTSRKETANGYFYDKRSDKYIDPKRRVQNFL